MHNAFEKHISASTVLSQLSIFDFLYNTVHNHPPSYTQGSMLKLNLVTKCVI